MQLLCNNRAANNTHTETIEIMIKVGLVFIWISFKVKVNIITCPGLSFLLKSDK